MSKPRLTPWYPPEIKPVRVGVYEIFPDDKITAGLVRWWSHWNGDFWGYRCTANKRNAFDCRDSEALGPIVKWRGLARKP